MWPDLDPTSFNDELLAMANGDRDAFVRFARSSGRPFRRHFLDRGFFTTLAGDLAVQLIRDASLGAASAVAAGAPENWLRQTAGRVAREALERLQQERARVQEAAKAQRVLLDPAGMFGDLLVTVAFRPLHDLSGDWCDAATLPSGATFLAIGDAEAKGPQAALFAVYLKGLLRGILGDGLDPADVLKAANGVVANEIHVHHKRATLVLCLWNPATATLKIANAGHCSPLVHRDGGWTPLALCGMPLGLPSTLPVPFAAGALEIPLAPGDLVVLYTDGVTDQFGNGDDQYSEARLLSRLEETKDAQSIPAAVLADVERFRGNTAQTDDQMVLVIQRTLAP